MADELAPKVNPQVASESPLAPVTPAPSALQGLAVVGGQALSAADSFFTASRTSTGAASRAAELKAATRANMAKDFEKAQQMGPGPKKRQFERRMVLNYAQQGVDTDEIANMAKTFGHEELANILVSPQERAMSKVLNDDQYNLNLIAGIRLGLSKEAASARAYRLYDLANNKGANTKSTFDSNNLERLSGTMTMFQHVVRNKDVALTPDLIAQSAQELLLFEAERKADAARLGIPYDETATAKTVAGLLESLQREDAAEVFQEAFESKFMATLTEFAAKEELSQADYLALTNAVAGAKKGALSGDNDLAMSLLVRATASMSNNAGVNSALAEILQTKITGMKDFKVISSFDELHEFNKGFGEDSTEKADGPRVQDDQRKRLDDKTLGAVRNQETFSLESHARNRRSIPTMDEDASVAIIENLFQYVASAKETKARKGAPVQLKDSTIDMLSYRQGGEGPTNLEILLTRAFEAGTPSMVFDYDGLHTMVKDNLGVHESTLRSKYGINSTKFKGPQAFYVTVDEAGNSQYHLDPTALDQRLAELIDLRDNPKGAHADKKPKATLRPMSAGHSIDREIASLERAKGILEEAAGGAETVDPRKVIEVFDKMNAMDVRDFLIEGDGPLSSLLAVQGTDVWDTGFRELYGKISKLQEFNGEVERLGRRFAFIEGPMGSDPVMGDAQDRPANEAAPVTPVEVDTTSEFSTRLGKISENMSEAGKNILSNLKKASEVKDNPLSRTPEEIRLRTIRDQIKADEGFMSEAGIPTDGDKLTVGYGFTTGVEEGQKMSRAEANERLDMEIAQRLTEIEGAIPTFKDMPDEAQAALFSSWYRGSLVGSPETLKLINEGKFNEAADEFLNNNEYRNAEARGRPGIRGRMEKTAEAIRSLAPEEAPAKGANDYFERLSSRTSLKAKDLTPSEKSTMANPSRPKPEEMSAVVEQRYVTTTNFLMEDVEGYTDLPQAIQDSVVQMGVSLGYERLKSELPDVISSLQEAARSTKGSVEQASALAKAQFSMLYNVAEDGSVKATAWVKENAKEARRLVNEMGEGIKSLASEGSEQAGNIISSVVDTIIPSEGSGAPSRIGVGEEPSANVVAELAKNPADAAMKYYGLSEGTNGGAEAIKAMFEGAVGSWNPGNKSVAEFATSSAWCAAFITQVLKDSGVDTKALMGGDKFDQIRSKSYRNVGTGVSLKRAKPGDLMVKRHSEDDKKQYDLGWGHVGIVTKVDGDEVYYIGGNTGDMVQISSYNAAEEDVNIRRIKGASDIEPENLPSFGQVTRLKASATLSKVGNKLTSLWEDIFN